MTSGPIQLPPASAPASGKSTRILVACSMKSGSTYIAKVLSLYFGADRVYPQDYWGNREQNLLPDLLAGYSDRPFVTQMHVRPHQPNVEAILRFSLSVVYVWRNLGDVIVSFDDHIRLDDHRNPVCYVDDRERYLALPAEHRYNYLIHHAVPWYISFYLSWRRAMQSLPVVESHYEELVADRSAFFARMIESLAGAVERGRLDSILRSDFSDTRFNRGVAGRSNALLSSHNKGLIEDLLLSHPEDLSGLWLELPWRGVKETGARRPFLPGIRSLLQEVARCPHNREAGGLVSTFPYLRIAVTGEDFYFVVPAALLAAPAGMSARLRLLVRGQVGSHFSLYWRNDREDFAEERSMHVPYAAAASPSTVEFPLHRVTGTPAWFRLDCFNGMRNSGAGDILEILRVEA